MNMGKGYIYRCPRCGHEEELITGIGFTSPTVADIERENILSGFYGPKAQAALVAHPEALVEVKQAPFQCGACGKLENRVAVKVSGPVQVRIYQHCECGVIMHQIRGKSGMFCPTCREPLEKTDIESMILWD